MALELAVFINRIKEEADRLQGEHGLSIDAAYEQAVAAVFKTAAEAQLISPFEARILAELKIASRGGRPVSSTALAARLGVGSRRTMAFHLKRLERRGLVYRPGGPKAKGGWSTG
jgi:DNA-binding transcriptional ArsR family regulator